MGELGFSLAPGKRPPLLTEKPHAQVAALAVEHRVELWEPQGLLLPGRAPVGSP